MSAGGEVVGRRARIDFLDDVVDPIRRESWNIDNAGFQRGAVDGLNMIVPHGEPAYYPFFR